MTIESGVNTLLFQPHAKKPIDLIFTHLSLANVLTIIFTGIPEIILLFGIRHFLNDIGCKVVLYFYRVSRGVSLCTSSYLSLFQAMTLAPRNSRWSWLRGQISTHLFPVCLLFWIINMLLCIRVALMSVLPSNSTKADQVYILKYCIVTDRDVPQLAVFQAGMVSQDFLCVSLMLWTSVYMVKLLFSHHNAIHLVRSSSLCPQTSPEIKAAHTILALMGCFVLFYFTNCCLTIYIGLGHNVQELENYLIFVSCCYPTICPFLLIKNKGRLFR
ncbi:vomeronasal type-1 receptor 4-like [Erinaceus europaeus]|uniref:Vomeronasal type-1 receptor n=1 Tax=Erinaceus europaeus TaxID=9365 RepID=A0A1S3A012_ERIEU|nr:vomeronasal type-1 receptor 4-like [Erinaceus europaeus]